MLFESYNYFFPFYQKYIFGLIWLVYRVINLLIIFIFTGLESHVIDKEIVTSNLSQVQHLFLEYERKRHPESFSRSAVILNIVRNFQETPSFLSRVLFPKINDVKNFVNHIYSNILTEFWKMEYGFFFWEFCFLFFIRKFNFGLKNILFQLYCYCYYFSVNNKFYIIVYSSFKKEEKMILKGKLFTTHFWVSLFK